MRAVGQGVSGPEVACLVLPDAVRRQIMSDALRAAPEECCGLLIGRVEGARAAVTSRIESTNRAAGRRTGFEIDPALLLETQRRLRDTGEHVLGHYHSHPRGNAEPSDMDRQHAWVPGHVWVIVAPGKEREKDTFSAHLAVEKKGVIFLRRLRLEMVRSVFPWLDG